MAKKKSPSKPKLKVAARAPKPKQPPLSGMEGVRYDDLDHICDLIGEARQEANRANTEEAEQKKNALPFMTKHRISVYRHAGVELARIPGADKLRVRLRDEDGDAAVKAGESTEL